MRVTRIRVVTGLFALVATLALPAGAAGMANRPHPLFGNPVLGNSAEIATLRNIGGLGEARMRVADFDPATGTLIPATERGVTDGSLSRAYQELDLAAGDLDGDGFDELLLAYGERTADEMVQAVSLWLMEADTATRALSVRSRTYVGPTDMAPGSYNAQGQIRLAIGQFDADGPLEFVIARRASDHIVLTLMELDAEGVPVVIDSLVGQAQPDNLKESARLDVTAGDYDGDGIDEVALGGVRRRADNNNMEVFVTVYACAAGELVERGSGSYGNQSQGTTSQGAGTYFDHVAIAAGHLRPDVLRDRIVFSWTRRLGEWNVDEFRCGPLSLLPEDEFWVTANPRLVVLDVDTGVTPWTLSGWDTGQQSRSVKEIIFETCDGRSDAGYTTNSLGVAVDDLTGDGVDEIVWAAIGKVYVLQVGMTAPYAPTARDSVTRDRLPRDPSRRVVAIADLDAAASGTAEWRSEFVTLDWHSGPLRTRVYRAVTNSTGVITGSTLVSTRLDEWTSYYGGEYALACGDFDGDGIRLGEPTEHAISDAIHPSVILGAPPVHFDEFGGLAYDITGCFPGENQYGCPDFVSAYSLETSVEFAVETEIKSDWGLSTTLKGYGEGFGARVEGSFTGTYGQGFSRTASQTHGYQASYTVSTSGGDRILTDMTSYDLWEYPVYGPGREVLGHVAVIEPGSVEPSVQWITFDGWTSLSGSGAPAITHEPGNVLSYPKTIPVTGAYGDRWMVEAVGWEVGLVGAALRPTADYFFDMRWSDISSGSFSKSWNAGFEVGASISYEAGDPLGEVKAGMSAEVTGSYEMAEMSTHTVTVGQDIHLGVTLGNLGGAQQAPYFVYPYVYRSITTGALVLDYRVVPGGVGTWWDLYRGAPDLTFIQPRLHHEAKGLALWDPTSRNRSPDVRVYPGTAAVGETVQVRAIVRNFSLVDGATPASVRFRAVDPHGATFVMEDLDGDTTFVTDEAIPAREGRPVTFQWVVPPYAADTLRVTAEADPHGALAEVHEGNNAAYVEFYAVGGNVDVAWEAAASLPFRLEPVVPNPFRGVTRFAFALPARARARLEVFDVAGRLVARLVDGERAAGRHVVDWDGRTIEGGRARPGVYLCRYSADDRHETRRLVRLD